MVLTRVDSKKLRADIARAERLLAEANALLGKHLVLLTERERATIPRVRTDFPFAARRLAAMSGEHADLVAITDFDPAAVTEDLDNVEALLPLEAHIDRLGQLVADSRLAWTAEAYVPTLELYGVAKVKARKEPALGDAIGTLGEVFATPRRRAKKGEPETP